MADSTGFYSSFQSNIGGNNYYSDQSRRATDDFAVTKNYSDSDAHSSTASSLAGVGIFFQQDSDTNEVFVKTIVKGGSADRSGVLRVGDVVVRVDHDNVEGQPLSTLRSRILGSQGSYVTLGFRRREGTETTYYDVPLMRGSPEYFESLKATQPLQEEIERLRRHNAHLEAQRVQDAAELQRFRAHMETQRQEFDRKFLAMDDTLARKDEELSRLRQEMSGLADRGREADGARHELSSLREALQDDARRAEEKESLRLHYIEDLKHKMEEERQRMEAHIRKLEQEVRAERRLRDEAEARESRLLEENRRRGDTDKARRLREGEARHKFEAERRRLQEALKVNEAIGAKLRDVEPKLAQVHSDLATLRVDRDPLRDGLPAPSSSSAHPSSAMAGREEDDTFFMA